MRTYVSSRSPSADLSQSKSSDLAKPKDFGPHGSIATVESRAAIEDTTALTPSEVLSLQRTIGNQRVGELLRDLDTTTSVVEQVVQVGISDPGQPLEQPVRAEMESCFGHDF